MSTVSENIFHELDFFAVSFLLGIILVLAYDCLRIFRRLVRHGAAWISLEDLGYWIVTAFAIFAMLYQKNDGLIRGFSIGGVVLGMMLYNQFISRYTVRFIVRFLEKIIHMVQKVCKFVLAPFRKVQKAVSAKGAAVCGRGKKFVKFHVKYQKKRLKKIKNEIKIGISKK